MSYAIVALGGTGQTAVRLFLSYHLLRIGPFEQGTSHAGSLTVIEFDQETENDQGLNAQRYQAIRDFVAGSSAARYFRLESRIALPTHREPLRQMIRSAPVGALGRHPNRDGWRAEDAFATNDLLDMSVAGGAFATPAAIGFAWPHLSGAALTTLNAIIAARKITDAVVVTSTFGGAGTGFSGPTLALLHNRHLQNISLIGVDRYLTHQGMEQTPELTERYRNNTGAFWEQVRLAEAAGLRLRFKLPLNEDQTKPLWDSERQASAPIGNQIFEAAWWISRILQEYEAPRAVGGAQLPRDVEGIRDSERRLRARSIDAKNAIRYIRDGEFLSAVVRDPMGDFYMGSGFKACLGTFWRAWVRSTTMEPVERFIQRLQTELREWYGRLDTGMPTEDAAESDFRHFKNATARATMTSADQTLHPVLDTPNPEPTSIIQAAACETLYRLLRGN